MPEYLLGLAVGLVLIALDTAICAISGTVRFMGLSENASPVIILYLIGFMVQGMSEELLCRGYFMTSMARSRSVYPGLFISSGVFMLLHVLNPGVTVMSLFNVFLCGVFFGVYMIKRGNVWGAAAIHTMWNFAQANLLGLNVSGMEVHSTLFKTEIIEAGGWINSGAFGIEAGLDTTIVMLLAIAVIWLLPAHREKSL